MEQDYLIADRTIRISSIHNRVHELCRDYRCDRVDDVDINVVTSQEDIDFELNRPSRTPSPLSHDAYLEELAVYRAISERMPSFDTVLVHGSCVAVDGAAYLFCAPSGTGKSTHTFLWRKMLGERALMVNDDKPLIRIKDGAALAYGTPWNGKHHLSTNIAVPLRSICILGRSDSNHIEPLERDDAWTTIMRQVYRPSDPAATAATLTLVNQLVDSVDLWRLSCNKEEEAAELSYAAMSGKELS